MKNVSDWKPSKYVYRRGKLMASRNAAEVGIGSRLLVDTVAKAYQEYMPRFAHGRLIDLGCGKVPLYETYRGHVTEVTCVDWPNSIHECRYIDYECDLTEPLPFGDRSFETVILSDVLEHVPDPDRLWNEMARILAPGGHVLLNVPFLYWIHETPHDFCRYTRFALRRQAEAAGLTVRVLEAIGGASEVIADILGKRCLRIPMLGSVVSPFVQVAGGALGRISPRKRKSSTAVELFPLAYFMVAANDQ